MMPKCVFGSKRGRGWKKNKKRRGGEHLGWFLFCEKEKGHIPPSEKKWPPQKCKWSCLTCDASKRMTSAASLQCVFLVRKKKKKSTRVVLCRKRMWGVGRCWKAEERSGAWGTWCKLWKKWNTKSDPSFKNMR